jgi:nucleoside-diphosphate-sugar epimerase
MPSAAIIGHGWLGKLLSATLHQKGIHCHVSSRSAATSTEGITHHILDLPLSPLPKEMLSCEVVFFCLSPGSKHETYLQALRHVCEELQHQHPHACLAFCSSVSVYNGPGICDEQSPIDPGHVLSVAEQMVRDFSQNHLIFRLGGLYGEGRNPAHFFRSAISGGSNEFTNLVEGKTAADAMCFAWEKGLSGTLNIVSSLHHKKILYYTGLREKENLSPLEIRETEVSGKIVSARRLLLSGFAC